MFILNEIIEKVNILLVNYNFSDDEFLFINDLIELIAQSKNWKSELLKQ